MEGFNFLGMEQDEGYAAIAEARIAACQVLKTEDLLA